MSVIQYSIIMLVTIHLPQLILIVSKLHTQKYKEEVQRFDKLAFKNGIMYTGTLPQTLSVHIQHTAQSDRMDTIAIFSLSYLVIRVGE